MQSSAAPGPQPEATRLFCFMAWAGGGGLGFWVLGTTVVCLRFLGNGALHKVLCVFCYIDILNTRSDS